MTLSAAAPAGGAVVALASNSSSVTVPESVTVAAGSTTATFNATTSSVSAAQNATITASYGGSSANTSLSVTAAGGTFPSFSSVLTAQVQGTSNGTPFQLSLQVLALEGQLFACTATGSLGSGLGATTFAVYWGQVSVSGATATCQGLQVTSSLMVTGSARAQITTGTVTFTVNPQVVSTSGTVSGSTNLVSTLATVNGSFTGTYTAQ